MRRSTPMQRTISEDLVDRLRRQGASQDVIDFTERHVTRFSQADLDRVRTRWFWLGVLFASGILAVARAVS